MELVVETLVVVIGAIVEVVADTGRVVVSDPRNACPDPPPHPERVTNAARARNGHLDIGCRWAPTGSVLRSCGASMRLAGELWAISEVPLGAPSPGLRGRSGYS